MTEQRQTRGNPMNMFWKSRQPPEANADDLLRLAALTEQITMAAELLNAHQTALAEAVTAFAPGVVAAFDEWERAVNQWHEVAAKLNLKERHNVLETVKTLRPTIEIYRASIAQSLANVEWPETIEDHSYAEK